MEHLTHDLETLFEALGLGFDVFGVLIILVGVLIATLRFAQQGLTRQQESYHRYRVEIGSALLLGLEVLVAADIIKTVALEPGFENLGILAILVVIRTFLSWALVLEVEGRFPWQPERA